jgi:hypothetical protein
MARNGWENRNNRIGGWAVSVGEPNTAALKDNIAVPNQIYSVFPICIATAYDSASSDGGGREARLLFDVLRDLANMIIGY